MGDRWRQPAGRGQEPSFRRGQKLGGRRRPVRKGSEARRETRQEAYPDGEGANELANDAKALVVGYLVLEVARDFIDDGGGGDRGEVDVGEGVHDLGRW